MPPLSISGRHSSGILVLWLVCACSGDLDSQGQVPGAVTPMAGGALPAATDPATVPAAGSAAVAASGPTKNPALPLSRSLRSECDPAAEAPPPQRVWLLTPEQMTHTTQSLYAEGQSGPDMNAVTASNRTYDGNDAELLKLNTEQTRSLLRGAEAVAEFVVDNLSDYVACAPTDAGCFDAFVKAFATRAWRGPPDAEQLVRLNEIYSIGNEVSPRDGFRLAVEAVLKSPRFIYRTEIGEPTGDGRFRLTDWEAAAQLSYFLTNAPPDAELRALAANGTLLDEAVFQQQVQRLLADPRSRSVASRFLLQLTSGRSALGLVKDVQIIDDYSDELAHSMIGELERFAQWAFFDANATSTELLTSQTTFINQPLAGVYERPEIVGDELQQVSVEGTARAGFLSMPALMSIYSQTDHVVPTTRGRFVLDKLLCRPLGSPPDIPEDVPAANPELNARERLEVMQDYPACKVCHNIADPVGFAFDAFDPVGRELQQIDGMPIDTSGKIDMPIAGEQSFNSLRELAQLLASSEAVRACLNLQFFEFSQGRTARTGDGCDVLEMQQRFETQGGQLSTLVHSVLDSKFLHLRSPSK